MLHDLAPQKKKISAEFWVDGGVSGQNLIISQGGKWKKNKRKVVI